MIRRPAVAGMFYQSDARSLREQIERCYTHAHGPGRVPAVRAGERRLIGLVSPHAGYMYSGPVAAHGFAALAEDGMPEAVIIVGPNHTGLGSDVSIMASGKWRTPLGEVRIDESLANAIREVSDIIDIDETAHLQEHSLEVQLPFLQHLFGDRFKIVPICMMMQDEETSEEVGAAIGRGASGRDVLIIASTDFTHYEPHGVAAAKDRRAIDAILALDWRGLLRVVQRENITMCGYGPVAAMLRAAAALGAKEARLLKYATSGETAGPMAEVVGYGSIGVSR